MTWILLMWVFANNQFVVRGIPGIDSKATCEDYGTTWKQRAEFPSGTTHGYVCIDIQEK